MGGGNSPCNLITLCGSATTGCHWLAEQRSDEMRARGLFVSSWDDPALVPVVLYTGRAVYLTEDGLYRDF